MFWKPKPKPAAAIEAPAFFSHVRQDEWVAKVFAGRAGGYFLDFGAFDGVDLSNTAYLEREMNWRGICVEPNPSYYPMLCASRNVICVNLALWPESRQVLPMVDAHGLSSFESLKANDSNAAMRDRSIKRVVNVDTINPTELLDRFEAPTVIEYMSLDVEGAEYDVLTGLDLARYDIRLMTIEHDCSEERKAKVRQHLANFGYEALTLSYDDFFWKVDGDYPVDPGRVAAEMGAV